MVNLLKAIFYELYYMKYMKEYNKSMSHNLHFELLLSNHYLLAAKKETWELRGQLYVDI